MGGNTDSAAIGSAAEVVGEATADNGTATYVPASPNASAIGAAAEVVGHGSTNTSMVIAEGDSSAEIVSAAVDVNVSAWEIECVTAHY